MPARVAYLVYLNYTLVGVVDTEGEAKKAFPDQAITLVGPVKLNQPIDWDAIEEEKIMASRFSSKEYADMVDGVPEPAWQGHLDSYYHG
jgi:hypothetical protein